MCVLYVFWDRRLYYRSNMLQFLHGSVHVFEVAVLVLANPLHFLCETST